MNNLLEAIEVLVALEARGISIRHVGKGRLNIRGPFGPSDLIRLNGIAPAVQLLKVRGRKPLDLVQLRSRFDEAKVQHFCQIVRWISWAWALEELPDEYELVVGSSQVWIVVRFTALADRRREVLAAEMVADPTSVFSTLGGAPPRTPTRASTQ